MFKITLAQNCISEQCLAIKDVEQEFARAEAAGDLHWQQRIIDRYTHRSGDVSKFMQELKQRFSQWFNRRNNRHGPLWEGRYKSVLVEADEEALMTMAAQRNRGQRKYVQNNACAKLHFRTVFSQA